MARRRRTPQEKKRLSYDKDRRRVRTSSNKAPRKFVPRRRAWGHRAARRAAQIPVYLASDDQVLEQAEGRFGVKTRTRWRKWNDRSLAEHIDEQTWRRMIGRKGRKQESRLNWLLIHLEGAEREGFADMAYWKSRMPPPPLLNEAGLTVSPHPENPHLVIISRMRARPPAREA